MTSSTGFKGFTTFILLIAFAVFLYTGYRYITVSKASTTDTLENNILSKVQGAKTTKPFKESRDSYGITQNDSYGIYTSKTSSKPIRNVLGVTTTTPKPSSIDSDGISPKPVSNETEEGISEEFRDALLFKDLRYDFNNDGEVAMSDYPIFLEFINNPED